MTAFSGPSAGTSDTLNGTSKGTSPATSPARVGAPCTSVNPDGPEALEQRAVELVNEGCSPVTFRVKLYKFDRATNTKALARSVPYEGFSEEWVRENMGPGVWRCELMSGSSTHRGIQRVTEIAIADTSSPSPRANAWPVAPAAPQLQGFQPAPVTGGEVSPLMLMMSMLNQQATMMQSIVSASLNKTDNVTPLLQTAVAAVGPLLGNLFNRPATPVGELMQLLDVVGDRGAAPAPKPEGMLSQIIGALAQHAPQILERVAAAAATGQTQPGSTASIVPPASLPASQNAPGGPSPAHGSAQRGAESPAQTLAGTPSSAGEGAADQGEASPGSHKGVEVPPEYAVFAELGQRAAKIIRGAAEMDLDTAVPAESILDRAEDLGIGLDYLESLKPGQLAELLMSLVPDLAEHGEYVREIDEAIWSRIAADKARREAQAAQQVMVSPATSPAESMKPAAAEISAASQAGSHKAAKPAGKGKKS